MFVVFLIFFKSLLFFKDQIETAPSDLSVANRIFRLEKQPGYMDPFLYSVYLQRKMILNQQPIFQ